MVMDHIISNKIQCMPDKLSTLAAIKRNHRMECDLLLVEVGRLDFILVLRIAVFSKIHDKHDFTGLEILLQQLILIVLPVCCEEVRDESCVEGWSFQIIINQLLHEVFNGSLHRFWFPGCLPVAGCTGPPIPCHCWSQVKEALEMGPQCSWNITALLTPAIDAVWTGEGWISFWTQKNVEEGSLIWNFHFHTKPRNCYSSV